MSVKLSNTRLKYIYSLFKTSHIYTYVTFICIYGLERTKLSSQKNFDHFPIFEILISEAPNIRHRDDLPREELGIGWQAPRAAHCRKPPLLEWRAWQAPHGPRAKRSVGVYTSQ